MMHYPKIMQPTHVRWERVTTPATNLDDEPSTNGLTNGHALTNGATNHDDHENAMDVEEVPRSQEITHPTIFNSISPAVARNFAVVDTHYTAPPISNAGYPGPDGHILDPTSGPNGLASISSDLLDELSEDCRRAFEEARRVENGWKRQWGSEAQSTLRQGLTIGFSGWPL